MNDIKLLKNFKDKIALVTGAGSGLGRALSIKLAEYHSKVICTDINLEAAKETARIIKKNQFEATIDVCQMDVSDTEQIKNTLSTIICKHKQIDFLFNNAGTMIVGEIRDMEIEHYNRVLQVNLHGMINCALPVFKTMCERKNGHIINIASIAGLLPVMALNSPYLVSKHAAVAFSQALKMEGKQLGVKVTTVCPGFVATNIVEGVEYLNCKTDVKKKGAETISKGIPPNTAAILILKSVVNNKNRLIFPKGFKLYYKLVKLFPAIDKAMSRKFLRDFRNNDRLN